MSSRRTRSGASLCSSEPRRLRRTSSRKQQDEVSAEETNFSITAASASCVTNANLSSEVQVEKYGLPKPKAKLDSPKHSHHSSANIWERLVKNDGEFISDVADNEDKDQKKCGNGKAKMLLAEKVASLEIVKACRKPDILVSLLEGESAYPVNHHKDSIGFKSGSVTNSKEGQDSSKRNREKSVLSAESVASCNSERHSEALHVSSSSLCFFHNCECHRNSNVPNFSDMPDVPGEPFFVSLSKDENKELNMVKTSSGTVRVGCSLRKFGDHSRNCTDTCTPSGRSQKISAEHKSEKRSERNLYASDIKFLKTKLDEKGSELGHKSKKVDETELKETENKNTVIEHNDQERNNQNTENTASKHTWHQDINKIECVGSENSLPSSDIIQDKWKTSALTLLPENRVKKNELNLSSYSKSLAPCRSSHYPLMKEILTQQSYTPLTSAAASSTYSVKPQELHNGNSDKTSQKSEKTLKQSTKSTVSVTPEVVTDSAFKGVVKRSERLRCKSGLDRPVSIAIHKSVISTMKPVDKTVKDKAKIPNLKKSSKVTFSRETQRRSGTKLYELAKKSTVVKDAARGKTAMSREVMEAIIQSIEETVSGCSGLETSDDLLKPIQKDLLVTSQSTDDVPDNDTTSMDMDSLKMDHWSDCVNDHNYDMNINCANVPYSLTKNSSVKASGVNNGESNKTTKLFSSKSCVWKSKKTSKAANRSKSLKVKAVRSKVKSVTGSTSTEDSSSFEAAGSAAENNGTSDTDTASAESAVYSSGKRFRKKTRKAKEAFGDEDVFSDENWSGKKCKTRNSSASSDSNTSSCQRRPRRATQIGSNIADPVLEEHAFILWASENRGQLEQQHPGASSSQVDTFLFLRWCEVAESLKARFFLRAREAFSDDERDMIRCSSSTDLEASMCVDFFSDTEPVFTDFIRLPIERQRDMLRKWLKFFQKTLPKKEYIDFIITFKRACNRDSRSPSGGPKRTRMRCLDPSYYKMLFDMIRVTKPRVLEVYRIKQDKDKAALSETYSIILLKLVKNEPMTTMEACSRSQALTEILQDLGISDNLDMPLDTDVCSSAIACGDNDRNDAFCNEETRSETDTSLNAHEWRPVVADSVTMVPSLEAKAELGHNDLSFDESDYSLLDSDLAVDLLSGIHELPVLDQDTLDQVFLAPPHISNSLSQLKRSGNLYSRCLENLSQNQIPVTNHPSMHGSPGLPRLLPTDQVAYPKINIQYCPSTSANVAPHLPTRHDNILPQKYTRRDTCSAYPVRGAWCRKHSPMDMHTYSTSMESMIHSPAHFNGPHNKCFKVHAKVMSPQMKFNLQPVQLPVNSRSHQQNRLHPRVIPLSCNLQQRFPTIIYSPTNATLLDKLGSHHLNQMEAQPLPSSSATSSRISPQPVGLNTPSSLITSLSPLRSVKYSHSNKLYSPHCQMIPYRPRMQLMPGGNGGQRRSTHTVPISSASKVTSSKTHGSLQQIKVCLSTQTLKIPIAKLREPRKNSYIKGKVKNFNIQHSSLETYGSSIPCTQACQFSVRANPPNSVLAKVLNLQVVNEMEHLSKMTLVDGQPTCTVSNCRPVNSAFIGTMKPVTVQPISNGLQSAAPQLQLMSVASSPSLIPESKMAESTQAAILADSQLMNRICHLPQPRCIASSAMSSSHLSKCCFASSVHGVSLANVSTNTTHNINLAIPHTKQGEGLVRSQSVTSGGPCTDEPFEHCIDENDISGEFRVVGTCVVSATNTGGGDNCMINSDHLRETLYPPDVSGRIPSSVTKIETGNKITLDDETVFDSTETLFDSVTVARPFNLQHNQERCKGTLTPTKMTYAISYNSQQCVARQSLKHDPCTLGHVLGDPLTSPLSTVNDENDSENTAVTHNVSYKSEQELAQESRNSQIPVSTNYQFVDSQDGASEMPTTDTAANVRTNCWLHRSSTSTSSHDTLFQSKHISSSQTCVSCNYKISDDDDDDDNNDGGNAESYATVVGYAKNEAENSNVGDVNTTTDSVLACDSSVSKAVYGCTGSSNSTSRNASSHDSIGAILSELQQSNMARSQETPDVSLTRIASWSGPGVQELCEHEYSVASSNMSQGMLSSMGSVRALHTSACSSDTPGLEMLAETATSAYPVLSSTNPVLSADDTLHRCNEGQQGPGDEQVDGSQLINSKTAIIIHSHKGGTLSQDSGVVDNMDSSQQG